MPSWFEDEPFRPSPPEVGEARTAFAPAESVVGVLSALEEHATSEGLRVVTIRYDRLPPMSALLSDVLAQLADLALAAWPDWCHVPGGQDAPGAWRKAAARLCTQGRLPLPKGHTPTTSVRGLARAIDQDPLLIILADADEDPAPGSLLGLARVAEWLAREAGARVWVVVPDRHADSAELDPVSFDAAHVHVRPHRRGPAVEVGTGSSGAEPPPRVSPLIGRPNPSSGGEKMLADRLERDPALSGLFQYNIRLETTRGSRPLVDLAWIEGKVVVEVDGYYFHRDERAFSRDRNRDYELTISGFLVLRLPEDEVVADVGLAVEKIRDVVAFRRGSPQLDERA